MSKSHSAYTLQQVQNHNTENDCWIVVDDHIYDVTKFLNEHPGGKKILLKAGGSDASQQFHKFHSPQVIEKYRPLYQVGTVASANDQSQNEITNLVEDNIVLNEIVPYGDPSWYKDYVSPFHKESHRELRNRVRQFINKEVRPFVSEWEEQGEIPLEIKQRAAHLGITASFCGVNAVKNYFKKPVMEVIQPEEFDFLHSQIIIDECARSGSMGFLWGITSGQSIGLPPILEFGSEELKSKIAEPILNAEKFIALAITEPQAGSDVGNLQTEAKLSSDGSHYIVNGEKKWITQGLWADYFTTAVRTGGDGMGGVSLLLINRHTPGVNVRLIKCSGVIGSGTAYITFEDVKVPVSNLIGQENKGFKYIMSNFNQERLVIIFEAIRMARVCFEDSFKYAHKRATFGKRLIDHPVIREKLANMARQIEATQSWADFVSYQFDQFDHAKSVQILAGPIALLKAQSTKTLEYCSREACQIFGGLAYTKGGLGDRIERISREVRAMSIPGGSEEIMLDLAMRQAMKQAKSSNAKF